MGPPKDEGSYWGYEEQGNGQLHGVQIFQLTRNDTTELSYAKIGESLSEVIKQKWVGSKFFLVQEKMIWLSNVFWWKESFWAWQWQTSCISLNQLAVRNGIKNQFAREIKIMEGSGWKISYIIIFKKFQLQPLKVFTLKNEELHSWISSSVFLNLRTHYVHHST